MADYDSGEVTDRERTAADRQKQIAKYNDNTLWGVAKYNQGTANNLANWNAGLQSRLAEKNAAQTSEIAEYNAEATRDQLLRQMENYDEANQQNASLRDTQFKQASRKSEAERFEAQRNLQNAAIGLLGSMNQAMNGSTVGNTMSMLRNRNDADNSVYWQALQDNRNAIQNAYDESYNQNQIAKRDAAINAIKALQDIQGDLASNLGNIQNELFANLGNIRGDQLASLSNTFGDLLASRRNLQGDLAANLNNINPNLYEEPADVEVPNSGYAIPANLSRITQAQGSGGASGTGGNATAPITQNPIYRSPGDDAIDIWRRVAENMMNGVNRNESRLLDYIMPENAEQNILGYRNRLGNNYFGTLVNRFNNR